MFRFSHDHHGDLLHSDLSPSEDYAPVLGGVWRGGLSHQEEREELFKDAHHHFFKV